MKRSKSPQNSGGRKETRKLRSTVFWGWKRYYSACQSEQLSQSSCRFCCSLFLPIPGFTCLLFSGRRFGFVSASQACKTQGQGLGSHNWLALWHDKPSQPARPLSQPASQPACQPASQLGGKVSIGATGWILGSLGSWNIMTPDPRKTIKIHENPWKASQPASI